ncbi:copper resistance CopC family protein [Nesterenkonia aerolata]|uniref:Copper resistance protein CopC n=1 Tax=Nesterenkonia aerolata TaxID=3074079 RepID=A0ABU2DPC8_9MICC|nr:copper resistance protein CopC [Nesterenkonia sp. LY-0111]MDR8018364.1 copper resistance protein CopC [Nesterenkonia sp. LY-0111]
MPHAAAEPTVPSQQITVRRLAGAAAVGALALGTGVAGAAPAWAHDTLIGSTPDDDARVTEPLEDVTLEFSGGGLTTGEGITNEIRVTDEDGEDHGTETEVDGSTMSTSFEEPLPDGEYDVVYRVVYSDGHDEEGTLSFTVDAGIEAAGDEADDETGDETEEPAEGSAADTAEDSAEDASDADADDAAEADGAQDPVSEEGGASGWIVVLLGIGGVLIVLLAVIMMRRKVNQVEEWKQGRREPGGTGQSSADQSSTDQPSTDQPSTDESEGPDRTP